MTGKAWNANTAVPPVSLLCSQSVTFEQNTWSLSFSLKCLFGDHVILATIPRSLFYNKTLRCFNRASKNQTRIPSHFVLQQCYQHQSPGMTDTVFQHLQRIGSKGQDESAELLHSHRPLLIQEHCTKCVSCTERMRHLRF